MDRSRTGRLRAQLAGEDCVQTASVFDPISARIADALGFPVGMLGGSVASACILGAPDVVVLTSRELADQMRRITQVATLSMMVDADHGFGNALNVMRTVTELEWAGAAALTLEDTSLPASFGSHDRRDVISRHEMVRKLEAALEARGDPRTVIVARTEALNLDLPAAERIRLAVERARAYVDTGVDALFLASVRTMAQVEAVHEAVDVPLIASGAPAELTDGDLAARGVRLSIRGHAPFRAYVQAIHLALVHQSEGRPAAELREHLASAELMRVATGREAYDAWADQFLSGG